MDRIDRIKRFEISNCSDPACPVHPVNSFFTLTILCGRITFRVTKAFPSNPALSPRRVL
jgi:hypothetical protein